MVQTLTDYCQQQLADLATLHRKRELRTVEKREGAYLWRDNKKLLDFSSNDYLGLSQHPLVVKAAQDATAKYGAGAASSRLVGGEHPLFAPLQARLAAHHGQEAGLIFSSGYAANMGAIGPLGQAGDLVLGDKLCHASMLDGARISGADLKRFAHNDVNHARTLLEAHRAKYRHCVLMVEQVYSMDGDTAPLQELAELAREYQAWLLIDVAHSMVPVPDLGTVPGLVIVGTLSKALGSVGGYVVSSQACVDFLISTARTLIFSTGLPPSAVAAADAAMHLAYAQPEIISTAYAHAHELARLLDVPAPGNGSAILPVVIGEDAAALYASQRLEELGFAVPAIRPPTVPPGSARLRISCTALHTPEHIAALAEAVNKVRAEVESAAQAEKYEA
jgi:8-amino-7-oxononanoate synthase